MNNEKRNTKHGILKSKKLSLFYLAGKDHSRSTAIYGSKNSSVIILYLIRTGKVIHLQYTTLGITLTYARDIT